jgi:predicted O-methyltransferase YrrM
MTIYASHSYAFGAKTRQLHYRKDSSDEAVIAAILGRQQYHLGHIVRMAELMDYANHVESSGRKPLIVDAGANIGAASIFFAAKMPNARIVAIEPDR